MQNGVRVYDPGYATVLRRSANMVGVSKALMQTGGHRPCAVTRRATVSAPKPEAMPPRFRWRGFIALASQGVTNRGSVSAPSFCGAQPDQVSAEHTAVSCYT